MHVGIGWQRAEKDFYPLPAYRKTKSETAMQSASTSTFTSTSKALDHVTGPLSTHPDYSEKWYLSHSPRKLHSARAERETSL
jgi:hypothetical protein